MKKSRIKNLKTKLILWLFKRLYGSFWYPFTQADKEWESKTETQRWKMYEAITDWYNSDAYKIEHEGIIAWLYKDLAEASKTEEQIAGYRLALIAEKSRDVRLETLAKKFKEIKILEQRNKSLT